MARVGVDKLDRGWILICVLLLASLYIILAICVFVESDTGQGKDAVVGGLARRVEGAWAPITAMQRTLLGPLMNRHPVISMKMFQAPLLLPVAAVEDLASGPESDWTMSVLSAQRDVLLTAGMAPAGSGPRRLLTVAGKGDDGQDCVLASIDCTLAIRSSTGAIFGRLAAGSDGFALEEVGSRRTRWVFKPELGGAAPNLKDISIHVTSRPRGKLLASIGATPKPSRTVWVPQEAEPSAGFLRVTSSDDGVDLVLVLVSALGVLAFEMASPSQHSPAES